MSAATDSTPPSQLSLIFATAILCSISGYFIGTGSSLGLFGSSSSSTSTKNSKRSSSSSKKAVAKSWPNSYDVTVHPDSSDEELMKSLKPSAKGSGGDEEADSESESESSSGEEDEEDVPDPADLSTFQDILQKEECKLVLVLRTDLGMTKGKMAAQAAHAALACYMSLSSSSASSPSSTSSSPSTPSSTTHPILRRWLSAGQPKIALQCKSEEEIYELQAKALSLGLCARVVRDAGRTQIASGSTTCLGIGPGPKSVVDGVTGHLKLL
ncbi:Gluconate transport-inducing protein [Agyrium rufum]|nr:Gluconate transport-inducing protein [Agyrium rufum]